MRLQPTFRVTLPGSIEEVTRRLRETQSQGVLGDHADAAGRCLDFRVPPPERRLWSPHLSVQLSPADEGVELFGRFSPRPEVWTFVMMVYFAAAFVAAGGVVYGLVQLLMSSTPWAFTAVPAGLGVVLGVHTVAMTGQRLSADQMDRLRERLDHVLAEALGSG